MKIFPYGIEILHNEMVVLKEEIDNIELWIIQQLSARIEMSKQAFVNKWKKELEKDEEVQSFPKKIDDMISLIISRPYFKNREQRMKEDKMKKESNFTVS